LPPRSIRDGAQHPVHAIYRKAVFS
jgi:hypothetical protein